MRSIPIVAAAALAVAGLSPAMAAGSSDSGGSAPGLPVAASRSLDADLSRLRPNDAGQVDVYVELTGTTAHEAARAAGASGSKVALQAAAATDAEVQAQADRVVQAVGGDELYVTTNLQRGVALTASADELAALASDPSVVSIKQIVPKHLTNSTTDRVTQAISAWNSGATGEGVVVAVIDTGIDYTHSDFGGAGTTAAYTAARALNPTDPAALVGTFPTSKVIAGWDFVGDAYTGSAGSPAVADANPLDCQGHGSHVAGTAAGLGVNADGSTATLDWATATSADVSALRIGPGSAPEAELIALRVFGCTGNTGYVGAALDWLADPANPKADVVNLSVGSDYSAVDDPENDLIDKLTALGTVVVASAGNGGDVTDVGGAPGNGRSTLTVANSVGDEFNYDAIEVVGAGTLLAGQYSVNYAFGGDVTGTVAIPGDGTVTGCQALSASEAAAVNGKFAWLYWDDNDVTRECGSTVRFNNAAAAGAIGVILTSNLNLFYAGIGGNAAIPGFQLTGDSMTAVKAAAEAGTLQLRMSNSLKSALTHQSQPAVRDTLNPGSSRGVHGSYNIVKPDVAAPGTEIVSAGVGTGNRSATMGGTSMSSPHVAGIAAGVVQLHPTWSTQQVKAAIMNTATAAVTDNDGNRYGPSRVGSGRVNAAAAGATPLLAYASGNPKLVSVTFGVVRASDALTQTRGVTIENTTGAAITAKLAYEAAREIPGVSYTVTPAVVQVPAGGKAYATVTLKITDPQALTKVIDPTMYPDVLAFDLVPRDYVPLAEGWLRITPQGGSGIAVPVSSTIRPASALSVPAITSSPADPTRATATFAGTALGTTAGGDAYQALTVPMQLLAQKAEGSFGTNETARGAAIAAVGATSNAMRVSDPADAVMAVGVAWYGNNTLPSAYQNETDILLDTNGDGSPEYAQYINAPSDAIDQTYVYTVGLKPVTHLVDLMPYAGVDEGIDTNSYDTRVAIYPVHLAALGIPTAQILTGDYEIGISVEAYSEYSQMSGGINDFVEDLVYKPAQPDLWFGDAGDDSIVFTPQPGDTLAVHRAAGATERTQALFLHLHNGPATQAEIVAVSESAIKLAIDPTSTPVGTTVGWEVSEAIAGAAYELYLVAATHPNPEVYGSGVEVAQLQADPNGAATGNLTVPSTTTPGSYIVQLWRDHVLLATETLEVTPAAIIALQPVAVSTAVGVAPVLPGTVMATCTDGSQAPVAVSWDAIDAASYAAIGMFQVSGTVAGTTVRAVATVSVVDPLAIDPTAGMTQELYRFYKNDGTHFYTTSAYEAQMVKGYREYKYEGVVGMIAPADFVPVPGYSPLHRFYKSDGTHFYTASTFEAEQVKTYPQYKYEGVVGFVPTVHFSGTDPVSRFYKPAAGTHFYTASAYEAGLVRTYPEYQFESITYFIKPVG